MMAYEKFEAWQSAHRLALEVFDHTHHWPRTELYVLTAQVRRAALSIPTNIAEGAAKRGNREFSRYLGIALGSSSELSYLLRFSHDRGLLQQPQWQSLEDLRSLTGRLVYGLYRKLRLGISP